MILNFFFSFDFDVVGFEEGGSDSISFDEGV